MAKSNKPIADIGIIGSGIACTATIIAIIEQLIAEGKDNEVPLIITVIERYPELWKGIPYGNRSSVNALSITTIHDFFTSDIERDLFFKWFLVNKKKLLKSYADSGGTTAANWLQNNNHALNTNDWNNIYLPRHIIGEYVLQRLNDLRACAETRGLVKINIIHGEAVAIKQDSLNKSITVLSADGLSNIPVKKVVIAIGSAPQKKLTNTFDYHPGVLYVNYLHSRNLENSVNDIKLSLQSAVPGNRNILIIGSNASSIELLYLLNNTPNLISNIDSITILSYGGKLPGHITYKRYPHEVASNLNALAEEKSYTIEQLVKAAEQDILKVTGSEVSVPDVDEIMGQTIKMLGPLDINSKKLFYGVYGVQLARIFRRSGTDYKKAAGLLIQNNKLNLLKGSYIDLQYNYTSGTTTLSYSNENQVASQLTKKFKVVINCTGSENLVSGPFALITDLIVNHDVEVNPSGKAFVLSDDLQAAPGIYVIGPLAGGNYNKLLYFWHLENASRIIYLSKYLAKELLR